MERPVDISINDFTYELPQDKIALYPKEERDASKLLVYKHGEIAETVFENIASCLEKNTVLVFNNTRVIRARLNFKNEKGQPIEIFCLEPSTQNMDLSQAMLLQKTVEWNCLVGNLKRWKDDKLEISKNNITIHARIKERKAAHLVIEFLWEPSGISFAEVLERIGSTPIPPYLQRQEEEIDLTRYQTVYARNSGSVAAPTAGLHFTGKVFNALKEKSIKMLEVTLHVGAGTFKPVKAERLEHHDMHEEWIDVDVNAIKQLLECEQDQIIAVGTTSLRTLESIYWMGVKAHLNVNATLEELEIGQWEAYDLNEKKITVKDSLTALLGWMKKTDRNRLTCHTRILIAPPYELKIAKGIITNFHQPQSTLLLLISAVVGDKWRDIYKYALENNFRFLSYGDSSLLLK